MILVAYKKKAKVYSSDSDVLRELGIFIIKTFGGVIFFFNTSYCSLINNSAQLKTISAFCFLKHELHIYTTASETFLEEGERQGTTVGL